MGWGSGSDPITRYSIWLKTAPPLLLLIGGEERMDEMRRKSLKIACGEEWQDIVQEAKLKCLGVQNEKFYQAYLFRSVNNLAINHLKEKAKMPTVSFDTDREVTDQLVEQGYTTNFAAIHDVSEFMRRHWNQKERDAIYASFVCGATQLEIAEALGISPTTAVRWLQFVKTLFREGLSDYATV